MEESYNNEKTVRTDLDFIENSMNNLKSKVDNSLNYYDSNNLAVQPKKDGNMLYSKMNEIMNKYAQAQRIINEKLNHEINSVRAVGEAYYKLDKNLDGDANKL